MSWSTAVDVVKGKSSLIGEDGLRNKKKQWLQKPANKCGNLLGRLPLCIGMPVYLTDHVDRTDKKLLKGRTCTIANVLTDDKITSGNDCNLTKPPTILLQFYNNNQPPCPWVIGDLAPGVYPLLPAKNEWFLGETNRILRKQLPIAPAFAQTIFSSQGQTIPSAKLNLNIALGMDIETGYVAVTRFQHADDVLILEPFKLSDFQRGRRLETDIYMAHCQSGFKGLNDPTVKAMIDEYTLSKKPKQPKRTRNTVEESGIPGFVLSKCAKCNTVMPMLQKRMHQATQRR